MLRSMLFAFGVMILLTPCAGAQSWSMIYPEYGIDGIHDMIHWNGDTVYACGDNWTLRMSTDAGETWTELLKEERSERFVEIETNGGELFLLVREWPVSSEDTVDHILYAYNPHTSSFREIAFRRAGSRSRLYSTYSIECTDDRLYVIERQSGVWYLHQSNDAGDTWTWNRMSIDLLLLGDNPVYFVGDSLGFAAGLDTSSGIRNCIAVTTNGGRDWENRVADEMFHDAFSTKLLAYYRSGSSILVAYSISGQVWLSRDSCKTWTQTSDIPWNSLIKEEVLSMYLTDEDELYVLGYDADTYKTTDGGEHWVQMGQPVRMNGNFSATKLIVLPAATVLVSSESGDLLRSSDGGLTWDHFRHPEINKISRFHFFNPTHGLLTTYVYEGDGGYEDIYSTTDGGETWMKEGDLRPLLFPLQEHFVSLDEIYMYRSERRNSDQDIVLFKSSNRGRDWAVVKNWGHTNAPTGTFNAHGRLFFIKNDTETHVSTDAGISWNRYALDDELNSGTQLQFAVDDDNQLLCYCLNARRSWPASTPNLNLFVSQDSCRTWENIWSAPDSLRMYYDFDVVDAQTLYILFDDPSSYGSINMVSHDGGHNWSITASPKLSTREVTYFPPVAYSLHHSLALEKTQDLWQHSEESYSKLIHASIPSNTPRCIFVDENHGWLIANYAIVRTSNGGASWVRDAIPGVKSLECTVFPNPVKNGERVAIQVRSLPPPSLVNNRRTLRIRVYDAAGRMIATIADGEVVSMPRTFYWNPARPLAPGTYYIHVVIGRSSRIMKLVTY